VDVVAESLYKKALGLEMGEGSYQLFMFLVHLVSLLLSTFLICFTFLYEWRKVRKHQSQVAPISITSKATPLEVPQSVPALDVSNISSLVGSTEVHPELPWPAEIQHLERLIFSDPEEPHRQVMSKLTAGSRPIQIKVTTAAVVDIMTSHLAKLISSLGGLTVLMLLLNIIMLFLVTNIYWQSTAVIFSLKANCVMHREAIARI